MTLSRFAAVQWLSFAAAVVLLLYLLGPILTLLPTLVLTRKYLKV